MCHSSDIDRYDQAYSGKDTCFICYVGCFFYKPIVDFAGCGATTPLLGFGYSLAEGVKTAVDKSGLIGALTGGLTGAAGGIGAAIVFGYLITLVFKGRPRD